MPIARRQPTAYWVSTMRAVSSQSALGVDPYTNFPPLAQKLTDVASATAAGGLTVKAALAVIPGGAAVIAVSSVSTIQSASDTLRDKTSAQIAQEVKATLLRLDVPPDAVARFATNQGLIRPLTCS